MVPVKELLNVVVNCEMWGRLKVRRRKYRISMGDSEESRPQPRSRGGHRRLSRAEYYAWLRPRDGTARVILRACRWCPQLTMCLGGAPMGVARNHSLDSQRIGIQS